MDGLGLEVDVMTFIDAVIVGGGLGFVIGLGDFGTARIVDFDDVNRGRALRENGEVFLLIIKVGLIDFRLKIHTAISSGNF